MVWGRWAGKREPQKYATLNSWVFGDDDDGDRIGEEGERGEGDGRRFGSSPVRVPGKENKKRQE